MTLLNAYVDIIAVGSPNFFRGVYNGSGASSDVVNGSITIQKLFESYFQQKNITYAFTSFDGRSDYGPFISVSVTNEIFFFLGISPYTKSFK